MLSDEEAKIYRQFKNSQNPIKVIMQILKTGIDKYWISSYSFLWLFYLLNGLKNHFEFVSLKYHALEDACY